MSVESDGRVSDDVVEKFSRGSCRVYRCVFFVVTLAGYLLSMVPLISFHMSRKMQKRRRNLSPSDGSHERFAVQIRRQEWFSNASTS